MPHPRKMNGPELVRLAFRMIDLLSESVQRTFDAPELLIELANVIEHFRDVAEARGAAPIAWNPAQIQTVIAELRSRGQRMRDVATAAEQASDDGGPGGHRRPA